MSSSELQVFCAGIACLQTFIQRNWLGLPSLDADIQEFEFILDEESHRELVLDGECFFPTVKSLSLLFLARCILSNLKDKLDILVVNFILCNTLYTNKVYVNFVLVMQVSDWWLLRYIFIHQRVLEESSTILNTVFVELSTRWSQLEEHLRGKTVLASTLQMEIGYTYLLYGEVQKAKHHFQIASEIAEFSVEWTG